jgi:tetratricopeptide (TPR) repeat protein
MGYALHQLSRYAEAVQSYQSAIRNKTGYASAHYNLGVSYVALRNRNAALEQYRILQRLDTARATKLFNQIK